MKAGTLTPVMPAPKLALQGTDGRPLDLERYKGKVVMVSFGFSSCSEVCPVTLATLAAARKKLAPAEAADVQVVYVTVDPERDTEARMKKYLASFDPTFSSIYLIDRRGGLHAVMPYGHPSDDFVHDLKILLKS
jgi:protein SCO1/2